MKGNLLLFMTTILLLSFTACQQAEFAGTTVEIEIKVIHENQTILYEKKEAATGKNAFEFMKKNAGIQYEMYSNMPFITGIENIQSDEKHYWALYINDEYATTGIGDIDLDENTNITWKMEKISSYGEE